MGNTRGVRKDSAWQSLHEGLDLQIGAKGAHFSLHPKVLREGP
jgi:hypothetical protein